EKYRIKSKKVVPNTFLVHNTLNKMDICVKAILDYCGTHPEVGNYICFYIENNGKSITTTNLSDIIAGTPEDEEENLLKNELDSVLAVIPSNMFNRNTRINLNNLKSRHHIVLTLLGEFYKN